VIIFVTDDDAVIRTRGGARLEPRLPIGFIGSREKQAHAGIAGALNVVPHFIRPVFVMSEGDKHFMHKQVWGAFVRIDAG
jgi:hypothetical protein